MLTIDNEEHSDLQASIGASGGSHIDKGDDVPRINVVF